MSPDGKLTTLYSFNVTDGEGPNGLVQGIDGNFYGATAYGAEYLHRFTAVALFLKLPRRAS